jgi:hypothetical protein
MPKALVTKSITAENTFSDSISLSQKFNVSLSGTWVATVFLQRSFDGGTTWVDVKSWTANTQEAGEEPESGILYRLGVKTGGFTSGTVVCRLSQ